MLRQKSVEIGFLTSEKVTDLGHVVGLPHRAEGPVEMITNSMRSESIVVFFSIALGTLNATRSKGRVGFYQGWLLLGEPNRGREGRSIGV